MEALHHKNFTAIAESVIKMTDCEVSAYWLAHEIYLSINNSFSEDAMTQTMQFFYKLLSSTSSTVSVYSHLEKLGISDSLPISTWFRRGFAGVLHESALEKIWDKVIGGCVKILAFVAFTLVETSRMALMQCQTSQEVIRCLCSASEETDEMIAQKAIEFWQKDGSHAFPDGVRRSLGSGGGNNKNIPATMVPWEGNLMDVYKAHPAEDQPEVFIPKAKKRLEELKTEKGEKEKRNP